jgi:hypothetical protein
LLSPCATYRAPPHNGRYVAGHISSRTPRWRRSLPGAPGSRAPPTAGMCPTSRSCSCGDGRRPTADVDAAVGPVGGDVARTGDAAAVMMPGHPPFAGARLDGSDDLGSDAGIDVGARRPGRAVHHWGISATGAASLSRDFRPVARPQPSLSLSAAAWRPEAASPALPATLPCRRALRAGRQRWSWMWIGIAQMGAWARRALASWAAPGAVTRMCRDPPSSCRSREPSEPQGETQVRGPWAAR